MTAQYTLVIGNKNLSSWSLRPWLALKAAGVPFDEVQIRLDEPTERATLPQHSPSGKVPLLKITENGQTTQVWDSLAILETIAERFPEAKLWPTDANTRAIARSYAAEMHSSFIDIRMNLPMDFVRVLPTPELNEATAKQVQRIVAAWEEALAKSGGPFLFGALSNADCMYAPVVSRFRTYSIALPEASQAYCARMLDLPALKEWHASAEAEVARGWK